MTSLRAHVAIVFCGAGLYYSAPAPTERCLRFFDKEMPEIASCGGRLHKTGKEIRTVADSATPLLAALGRTADWKNTIDISPFEPDMGSESSQNAGKPSRTRPYRNFGEQDIDLGEQKESSRSNRRFGNGAGMDQHVEGKHKVSQKEEASKTGSDRQKAVDTAAREALLYSLDKPTVALHQKYHDQNMEYISENMKKVQNGEYGTDSTLPLAKQIAIRRAARERFWRWPNLSAHDVDDAPFGSSPQQFCNGAHGDPGENVFVISLRRRPTKLENVLSQLASEGISAKIVDAVDGDAVLSLADMERYGVAAVPGYGLHKNLTTGEVGCFMSHYSVWHYMDEHNIESAMILEDDFDFQPDFAEQLRRGLIEASVEDWNLLYLGRSPQEPDLRRISTHVVQPGYTFWTVGYIIRLEAARALLKSESYRAFAPLDDYFSLAMGRYTTKWYHEEWGRHIPVIFRPLALTPPLVMPYTGSMLLSDTAMLRNLTRFVKNLPKRMTPEEEEVEIRRAPIDRAPGLR